MDLRINFEWHAAAGIGIETEKESTDYVIIDNAHAHHIFGLDGVWQPVKYANGEVNKTFYVLLLKDLPDYKLVYGIGNNPFVRYQGKWYMRVEMRESITEYQKVCRCGNTLKYWDRFEHTSTGTQVRHERTVCFAGQAVTCYFARMHNPENVFKTMICKECGRRHPLATLRPAL